MATPPFDTVTQQATPFPPHGRVRLRVEGRLLVADADGPFNVELLQIIREAGAEIARQLPPLEHWGNFCEYHGSAMATPEALQVFEGLLRASGSHGGGPSCTAYVIAAEVEGAGLMEAIYERAFAAAGLRFRAFADAPSAKAWLLAELDRCAAQEPLVSSGRLPSEEAPIRPARL